MPALRGVIFARDLAWERAGRSAAAYRPGEEIEAVVTDLMPRKLTFKASLRDMVDDTRSLDCSPPASARPSVSRTSTSLPRSNARRPRLASP